MVTGLNRSVVAVVLALVAGCGTAPLPPPPTPSPVALPTPERKAPIASKPQTAFTAPAAIPAAIEPIDIKPPWTPVSAVEPFNDRAYPALREWTASVGGFHTAAKFAGLVEGQVQLRKGAGGDVLVPLDKLSENDRNYVKELIRVEPAAYVIIGKVSRVMDNHTLLVSDESTQRLVHLEGVEPLNENEKIGSDAKAALAAKVQDKHVWVEWREKDRFDFILGQVYLDGRNINLEMVADGHAKHDRLPRVNPRLANAELIARHKRLGLWKEDYAESPFGLRPAR